MNQFLDFVRAHGLITDHIIIGRWVRVPTENHPKKKNGAYKFMGDHGFVQDHATQTEVSLWRPDVKSEIRIDHAAIAAIAERQAQERRQAQAKAANRAKEIVAASRIGLHPYLKDKGFPDERGLIYTQDDGDKLVVPMSVQGRLCGCQLIGEDAGKKFLYGQATNDATFVIGSGPAILCEGYATALSIRAALRMPRSIVACFSAHNLKRVAQSHRDALVVADNDESGTGQGVAVETGLPYWLSDKVGEDFNDFATRVGSFRASQALKLALMKKRA